MSDIQNWSVAAESGYQYTTAPPDGFPEGELPSVVNNVAREQMAANKRRYADSNGSIAATGSAGAYAITTNETIALHGGMTLGFTANHDNTGAVTLNRNAVGAKDVRKGYSDVLLAGDILDGQMVFCVYDSTNDWFLATSIRPNTGSTVVDTFTGDAATVAFTLSIDPKTKKNLQIFISGIYQEDDTYSVSGTTLTFGTAPPAVDFEVRIISPSPAATVSDNAVGVAQLAGGTAGGIIAFDASGDPVDVGVGVSGQHLQSNGAAAPTWAQVIPTGVPLPYYGATAPTGFVLASGKTIGSGASAATERANDDCEALFTLIWDSWADTYAPVTGGRGVSAAADWAANKIIQVCDPNSGPIVALDNIGGTAAGRITSASTDGANAIIPGGRIGAETHTLTEDEMPGHTHNAGAGQGGSSGGIAFRTTSPGSGTPTTSTGGDDPHSNTQPGLCMNFIVKL